MPSSTPQPKPSADKVKMTVYVPPELLHAVRVKAAERQIKLSALVEKLLAAWISQKR